MSHAEAAGASAPRRLFVYNAGFLTQPRIRRILRLSGWDVRLGKPGPDDAIGVWGQSPTSPRGEAVSRKSGAPVVRVEDAFLRSLHPGRAGEPTLGLLIDETGVHFDGSQPSDIETLLATHPLDDPALLDRAKVDVDWMARAHLSKFSATDPDLPLPAPGYVLVIDQTAGDAAVRASGGGPEKFREMLAAARDENPGARILIKTHPETARGLRSGHFDAGDGELITAPVSPQALLSGAAAVYTLSSGLGFEAILAGLKPHVFGTPFYAGWGLSHDRQKTPRRGRQLSVPQLAAGALLLYPKWYDPYRDRLCEIEDVMATLEAQARAWREDRNGWHADAMSRWKHPHLRAFYGSHGIRFGGAPKPQARQMVWASKAEPGDARVRCEDGFLRSNGLGARLTPPISLVTDDLGIYYDPTQESRLELLIAESEHLGPAEIERSRALIGLIREKSVSKYNIHGELPDFPPTGRKILVVGQVEDDASIKLGAGRIATNAGLLAEARAANPGATLIYKPHPDVEAKLRTGELAQSEGLIVAQGASAAALMDHVDEAWTMTSLLGFEALLRGIPVTTTGAPFYAGWGLTQDLGAVPERRQAQPSIEALAHAALIAYPRYRDPVTGLPCPVEVAVERLAEGRAPKPAGLLAGLQRLRRFLPR